MKQDVTNTHNDTGVNTHDCNTHNHVMLLLTNSHSCADHLGHSDLRKCRIIYFKFQKFHNQSIIQSMYLYRIYVWRSIYLIRSKKRMNVVYVHRWPTIRVPGPLQQLIPTHRSVSHLGGIEAHSRSSNTSITFQSNAE